jgi:hypothetical protein
MSQLGSLQDNDKASFTLVNDGGNNEVARRVQVFGVGGLLEGVSYDYISVTYPSVTSEIYVFKIGGVGGAVQATLTIVYTSSTKDFISSVART